MALGHPGRPLLIIAALVAIAIPWYTVARTIANAKPADRSPVMSSGVVWAERVFTSKPPLTAWLRRHGVAYSVWAGRHPVAGSALER